jgi:hypothetical protein
MGISHEAEAYTSYIFQRMKEAKARRGALPIMFTIWGGTDIPGQFESATAQRSMCN